MRKILASLLLTTVAVVNASPDCRFAPTFSQSDLLSKVESRQEFLSKVLETEGKFMKELGFDKQTGLTISSVPVNERTGMPITEQTNKTSISRNEAIHIAILTKALAGDKMAQAIYSQEEALQILKRKVQSLDLSGEIKNELLWSVYALNHILEANFSSEIELQEKCKAIFEGSDLLPTKEYTDHIDVLLTPLIQNPHFRKKFVSEQSLLSNALLNSESEMTLEFLTGLYLTNQSVASVWHHSYLMNAKTQTRYGVVSKDHHLDWESKLTVLSMMGGISDIISEGLQKEGKLVRSAQNSFEGINTSNYAVPFAHGEPDLFGDDYTSCRLVDIPSNFAWGVATAAFQIEGAAAMDGRGPCIWDDFCKIDGTIHDNENADVADDFYHKYKQDVAMMKSVGIKNFRMSLSWSRILPKGTTDKGVNGLGVAFYNYVINELLAAGITPWVTLHHWDTPSALHNNTATGSFLSADIIDAFDNYADFCFAAYGDRVKHWITLNEPWTYSINGYASGVMAPGRCSEERCVRTGGGGNSGTEPYLVTHHLMLSHAKAAKTYKSKYQQVQGGVIGFTTNTDHALPFNPEDPKDHDAANRNLAFAFGWFVDPCIFGKYPDEMTALVTDGRLPTFTPEESAMIKGSVDYIGLNHYTSSFVKDDPTSKGGVWWSDSRTQGTKVGIDGKLIGPQAESTWLNVYPPGIRGLLNWIDKRYNHPIIYVFENGVSVPHENDMPIAEALHDSFRVDYYKGYIQNAIDAVTVDGVDLRGYFAWSLMDNFEWADGYSTRFGMTYVDYANNQKRYIKDSLFWYTQFTRTGQINGTFYNPHAQIFDEENSRKQEIIQ